MKTQIKGLALVIVSAGALVASPRNAEAQVQTPTPSPQIVASGHGETRVVPDRATLTVSVETRGATAAAAGSENATRQRAILDAIRGVGIPSAQIATSGYNVWPEYAHQEGRAPRVTGYRAQNTVTVDVRQLDQIARVIDASLGAGATNIGGVSLYSSNVDSARRDALRSAVGKARADAEAMAQAAGGSLGALLELTSVDYQVPTPRPLAMMRVSAQADATPIEAGEQVVSATVTARWAFNPSR
jgi:uncharacterized protein YggE